MRRSIELADGSEAEIACHSAPASDLVVARRLRELAADEREDAYVREAAGRA